MSINSTRRTINELILLAFTWVGLTWLFFAIVYPIAGLPSPAPVPARTLIVLLLTWYLIRRHEGTWGDFGLTRPGVWLVLGVIVGLFIAKLLVAQGIETMTAWLSLDSQQSGATLFTSLEGNFPLLLLWLAIVWGIGAFGEEMIFRGFLLHRFAGLLGGTTLGWIFAVVIQALFFGLAHAWQGFYGMLATGLGALTYGIFYLIAGKNLWPVILVHGIWDTLGLVLIYLHGEAVL